MGGLFKWSWKSLSSGIDKDASYAAFEVSNKANIASIVFTLSWSILEESNNCFDWFNSVINSPCDYWIPDP